MIPEIIKIDDVEYVKKNTQADRKNGLEYCLVRTMSAGVFAGYVETRVGDEVVMVDARRIWYWSGAASLSQLAMSGTSKPQNCKFPCTVDRIILLGVIEIIPCTAAAQKSIQAVPIWVA